MAPELITVLRVELGAHHLRPGRTNHTISGPNGFETFPPFVALEIAHCADENSYYLFHIAENGMIADTWHQSLEEAIEQAEFEFEVMPKEWSEV